MIKIECFCSIHPQLSKEKWPNNLCGIPSIGQKIQSKNGILAKIIDIIHCEVYINAEAGYQPFLKLHLANV